MTVPLPLMRAGAAAEAYARTASGQATATGDASGFGATLERAIRGVANSATQADEKSVQAIAGKGDLTEVVTAVSQAELAVQTATTIRDRVVQAYQDIMKMPI